MKQNPITLPSVDGNGRAIGEGRALGEDLVIGKGRTIEFPGSLPAFSGFGGCGTHPQFLHLQTPPVGYRFVHSHGSFRRLLTSLTAPLVFGLRCLKKGAGLADILKFTWSRSLFSQFRMGLKDSAFVFFPSVPFHFNQFPWVIEIEDTTTLFLPFLRNGDTAATKSIHTQSFFPIYRELLESPRCRGIITHIKATADSLPLIFNNPALKEKVFHIPIGIQLPDWETVKRVKAARRGGPLIVFTNSWHQMSGGFYVRGGLDVIEAFREIKAQVPEAHLVIRSRLPRNLPKPYLQLIRELKIEVIESFLPKEDWERLKMEATFFLFPAARIHIVSLLEAMAYGMTLISANGWGVNEYVQDGHNGVIIAGRENVSWLDWQTGILREDYASMYHANPAVIASLTAAFLKLHRNPEFKARLTSQARDDVEQKYTLHNWNERLKEVFDKIAGQPLP